MHLRVFSFLIATLLSSCVSAGRVAASQVILHTHRFGEPSVENLSISGFHDEGICAATSGTAQSEDSRKDDFKMPKYHCFARVRPAELEHIWENTFERPGKSVNPKQIVDKWGEGNSLNGSLGARSGNAKKGITWEVWDKEKLSIRIPNFDKWCKGPTTDEMTLPDFARMKHEGFSLDFGAVAYAGLDSNATDVKRIKEWLENKYQYGKEVALQLADAYVDLEDHLRDIQTLAAFATLDSKIGRMFGKKDGVLTYIEAHEALSKESSPVETRIQWEDVARVESSDFAGLGFPSSFTNDILDTMTAKSAEKDKGKIVSQEWEKYKLSAVLTDFIKRDKLKEDQTKKEKFSGKLKFFQVADVLPGGCGVGGEINLKFGQVPTGVPLEATGRAPTLDQLTGRQGKISASTEDFKRWLDEKGYKDGLRPSSKYATDMANQVVKWGSGLISVPGVERPGPQDIVLQGPKGEDQYTDVACRLAAFVQFDKVVPSALHGKLKFDKALPILYEAQA